MVTCLYGIGRVVGAECMAVLYGACLLLCILCGFLFRCNRAPKNRKRFLLGMLIVAVCADLGMFLLLFPGGEYRNYGIGAACGAALFPLLLMAAAAALTAYHSDSD